MCAGICSSSAFPAVAGSGRDGGAGGSIEIDLREGKLLGGGASGSVRRVDCLQNGRTFALKRMRKCAVMSTPEHIYCEQNITRELKHFTCMRQHASFQDSHHLYFLFDYLDGCDLMDALASVAGPYTRPLFAST